MHLTELALQQPTHGVTCECMFFTKSNTPLCITGVRSSLACHFGPILPGSAWAHWHQQAAEAQPRPRARVWRHRALPDWRRSRAHRAARLEGRLAAAHPDGLRYPQRAEPAPGQASAGQAIWPGGYSDSMVCLREASPRVTTPVPRTLTSPSLCLAGLIGSRYWPAVSHCLGRVALAAPAKPGPPGWLLPPYGQVERRFLRARRNELLRCEIAPPHPRARAHTGPPSTHAR